MLVLGGTALGRLLVEITVSAQAGGWMDPRVDGDVCAEALQGPAQPAQCPPLMMEKAVPGTRVPGRFPDCMGQLGTTRWQMALHPRSRRTASSNLQTLPSSWGSTSGKSNQRAASCPQVHGPELSRICWQRAALLGLMMPRGSKVSPKACQHAYPRWLDSHRHSGGSPGTEQGPGCCCPSPVSCTSVRASAQPSGCL